MKLTFIIKLTIVAVITSFCSFQAIAQRAYLKAGGGYSFPMGSELVYQVSKTITYNQANQPITKNVYEGININFAKGASGTLSLGYFFENNLGFELGIGYLNSSKSTVSNTENNVGYTNYAGYQESKVTDFYSRLILLQPSILFTTSSERCNLYSRVGLVATFGTLHSNLKYSNSDRQSAEIDLRLYGGTGLGFQAALGTDIKLNDKAAIFLEGTFNNLSYSPTKGEITRYFANGIDRVPSMETIEKEYEFIDDYVEDGNVTNSSSQPAKQPKQRYGMSTVGLNLGLKYSF